MQDRIGFLLDGVRPNDGDWFSDIVSDPKEPAFSNCRRESGGFKMPGASRLAAEWLTDLISTLLVPETR